MKNKRQDKQNINTNGGTFIGGSLSMGNNNKFVGRDDYSQSGLNSPDVEKLFESLYGQIDNKSNLEIQDKEDLKAEVEELRKELDKRDQANETFLMRRLRNIGRMAPDILEATLALIVHPALGLGVIAKKIAEKAKASAA